MSMSSRWSRWAAEIKVGLTKRLRRADRIFFVSDLHLADGGPADLFGSKDAELIAFLDHVQEHGDKLVILGDVLDLYVAGSFERVLRAHKKVLRRLKALADEKEVIYVAGNHDEEILIYEDLLNFTIVERLVLPPDVLVLHGHEYDVYFKDEEANAWGRWLSILHARFEQLIGSPIRAPLASYDNRANRVAHWIAYHILRGAEIWANVLVRSGFRRQARGWRRWVDFWNRTEQGDMQAMFREVTKRLPEIAYRTLVCGHTHQPGVVAIEGKTYVNTGTWTRDMSTYVLWDGQTFTCRDWVTGVRITDELYRPFIERHAPIPLRTWWRKHYRGWFRFEFDKDPLALPTASVRELPRTTGDAS